MASNGAKVVPCGNKPCQCDNDENYVCEEMLDQFVHRILLSASMNEKDDGKFGTGDTDGGKLGPADRSNRNKSKINGLKVQEIGPLCENTVGLKLSEAQSFQGEKTHKTIEQKVDRQKTSQGLEPSSIPVVTHHETNKKNSKTGSNGDHRKPNAETSKSQQILKQKKQNITKGSRRLVVEKVTEKTKKDGLMYQEFKPKIESNRKTGTTKSQVE